MVVWHGYYCKSCCIRQLLFKPPLSDLACIMSAGVSICSMCSVVSCMWTAAISRWGQVMHICISKLPIIGSDNGLSPGRRQAIIWTNAEILLIGPLGTNFSEIVIKIHILSSKKMHLKMSSGNLRPFCLGLNVICGSSPHATYNSTHACECGHAVDCYHISVLGIVSKH